MWPLVSPHVSAPALQVRQDVMSTLRMRAPRQFEVSFFRPNLLFSVVQARSWLVDGWLAASGA